MSNKKQAYPSKECPECHGQFIPTRFWQEYCSKECRWKYWSKRQKRDSSKLAEKVMKLEERVNKIEND